MTETTANLMNGKCGAIQAKDIVSTFRVHFLAMCRLNTLPWKLLETELKQGRSSELIVDILNQTCLHKVCVQHPPSVKYRRLFLQELIKMHESTTAEPLDELYDALSEVLCLGKESIFYKSYFLPSGDTVSLTESQAVISEGTTGLVTWEAAMYLTEWALENPHLFSGTTLLELGSGVGLTGIALCRHCKPKKYVFSDFHPSVLQKLEANVELNSQDLPDVAVSVEELDWENVSEGRLRDIGADTVIAADVVYDPDIVDCLVSLLSRILRSSKDSSQPNVYIASTIRNPETYSFFKKKLTGAGVTHSIITGPTSEIFPYNRLSSIELIKLHL
ncbi:protein-lysine N-methyltransferase EEF2KMT [Engraulis encrasicolus]|uniref:protein-lysine N-methyltransferase EEF2KMT n=1 Tax=Engraulis encrasicolus TaxID=184585 RepID=UPI002FCFD82A